MVCLRRRRRAIGPQFNRRIGKAEAAAAVTRRGCGTAKIKHAETLSHTKREREAMLTTTGVGRVEQALQPGGYTT